MKMMTAKEIIRELKKVDDPFRMFECKRTITKKRVRWIIETQNFTLGSLFGDNPAPFEGGY